MGGALSSTHRPLLIGSARRDRRVLILRHGDPKDSILPENWKTNDVLYQFVETERKLQMTNNPGSIMMTIAMYSPCEQSRCKCKEGTFIEDEYDTVGWADSKCTRSGCNHPLSDHIRHIEYLSNTEYMAVIKLVFDINNIKALLENLRAEPKSQRNIVIEKVYNSAYKLLCKSVRYDPFKAPNVNAIYGSPPFEHTSIQQILLNFCVRFFGSNDEDLTFKQALMVTKFLLHSFDSWMWIYPEKKPNFNSNTFSNSYNFYYHRYMVYCEMPRLAHSISPRYKATLIFGADVLRYTLEYFYQELLVWCFKSNVLWNGHTNTHFFKYLPIYMNTLKTAIELYCSQIWSMDFCLADVISISELYE